VDLALPAHTRASVVAAHLALALRLATDARIQTDMPGLARAAATPALVIAALLPHTVGFARLTKTRPVLAQLARQTGAATALTAVSPAFLPVA